MFDRLGAVCEKICDPERKVGVYRHRVQFLCKQVGLDGVKADEKSAKRILTYEPLLSKCECALCMSDRTASSTLLLCWYAN